MIPWLKKYWMTHSAVAGAVVTFLMPSITTYASAHPKTVMGVLLGAVVIAFHSKAPKDK